MQLSPVSRVIELFGADTTATAGVSPIDWQALVAEQPCPFLRRQCIKVRKSQPSIAIGTCTVANGKDRTPIIICPHRLLERRQIFTDCLSLLTAHEPGNELHMVAEVTIPGGSVDYFLVSVAPRTHKVRDFVGIELQTMDTTGTVWPERQRFLQEQGLPVSPDDVMSVRPFGMNWKMTAKTILIQLHHKVETFEHINKKLALVVQDRLIAYMRREFRFAHLNNPPVLADPLHIHAYELVSTDPGGLRIVLAEQASTDGAGVAQSLGLQANAKLELEEIVATLEAKLGGDTVFTLA